MAKPLAATKPVLTPVPAAPAAEPAAKRGRKPKPTQWAKWAKSAFRFYELSKKLDAICKVGDAKVMGGLNNAVMSDEGLIEIAELVSALQRLDADRVEVPSIPKAAKGPRFVLNDKVRIVKKFQGKYLETGLYVASDLEHLTVSAMGKKDQALCTVDGTTTQVFVRYAKHLEKR